MPAFCPLSPRQAALYQQAVDDMAHRLETVSAIERRGLVLAFLMRLVQADRQSPIAMARRRPVERGRHLCADGTGLFPSPREIEFNCSCPDAAYMCKHIAAVLYGVGARLDREPGLLFTLRQVKEGDLVGDVGARAAASLISGRDGVPGSRRIADESSLSAVFGIDVAIGPPVEMPPGASSPAQPGEARGRKKTTSAPKSGRRRPAKAPRVSGDR